MLNLDRTIGLDPPPPEPVKWRGVDVDNPARTCEVMQRTWFAARSEVMALLGTERVRVTEDKGQLCKTTG
jgi:hypothetical protein